MILRELVGEASQGCTIQNTVLYLIQYNTYNTQYRVFWSQANPIIPYDTIYSRIVSWHRASQEEGTQPCRRVSTMRPEGRF